MKIFISFCLLFSIFSSNAQTLNQYDEEGKKHGTWKGYYEEHPDQLQFEGNFEHGEETGLFKFYQPGLKNPVATKFFPTDSDLVEVEFLSQKGKVISEGKMRGNDRIGEWKYYHKDSDKLMMKENYRKGKLDGEKLTWFNNGQIAESSWYREGDLHGERILYSEKGVILEHLHYLHGKLHGPAKFFNGKGELLTEGNYREDRHSGIWKYYENGSLKEEKSFPQKS